MIQETASIEGFDPKDEPLPFLSNFQDVFLSIGVVIFLVGVGILMGIITNNVSNGTTPSYWLVAGLCSAVALVVWWLSDVLVRKRRRILPGIVLCATFIMLSVGIYSSVYGGIFGERVFEDFQQITEADFDVSRFENAEPTHQNFREAARQASNAIPWSGKAYFLGLPILVTVMAFMYYRRFKLPFASAVLVSSAIGAVLSFVFVYFPYDFIRFTPSVMLLSGLAMMVAGIHYDMKDPERVSRFSGNGFWLHLFAAPTVLWGALTMVTLGPVINTTTMANGDFSQFDNPVGVAQSFVTLGVIAVFALVSLLLNRRALVVSGLISAGVAIGVIVNATGIGAAGVAATTLIVLGGGILLLGIGWHGARRALLTVVPEGGFWSRIFPRNDTDG